MSLLPTSLNVLATRFGSQAIDPTLADPELDRWGLGMRTGTWLTGEQDQHLDPVKPPPSEPVDAWLPFVKMLRQPFGLWLQPAGADAPADGANPEDSRVWTDRFTRRFRRQTSEKAQEITTQQATALRQAESVAERVSILTGMTDRVIRTLETYPEDQKAIRAAVALLDYAAGLEAECVKASEVIVAALTEAGDRRFASRRQGNRRPVKDSKVFAQLQELYLWFVPKWNQGEALRYQVVAAATRIQLALESAAGPRALRQVLEAYAEFMESPRILKQVPVASDDSAFFLFTRRAPTFMMHQGQMLKTPSRAVLQILKTDGFKLYFFNPHTPKDWDAATVLTYDPSQGRLCLEQNGDMLWAADPDCKRELMEQAEVLNKVFREATSREAAQREPELAPAC